MASGSSGNSTAGHKRKRPLSGTTSKSDSLSGTTSESDFSYCSNLKYIPSVSNWTIEVLEDLGIYYDSEYDDLPSDILDDCFLKTGNFGPLDEEQQQFVNTMKNIVSFDFPVDLLADVDQDEWDGRALPELNKNIDSILKFDSNDSADIRTSEHCENKRIEEYARRVDARNFLINLRKVISFEVSYHQYCYESRGPVPESMYVDVFREFCKMCQLDVWPGDLWTTKMIINDINLTSKADLMITPYDITQSGDPQLNSIVSVVEIKKATHMTRASVENKMGKKTHSRERLKSEPGSSGSLPVEDEAYDNRSEELKQNLEKTNDVCHVPPEISEILHTKVLGHHGGQLLLCRGLFERSLDRLKDKFHPGIIVIGTKVLFTMLELEGEHLKTLMNQKLDKHEHRATIYYSKPHNLLKKEDRDILIESCVRLKNLRSP